MSWTHFEDDCPGCRPVAIDPETGQLLPDAHPLMHAVNKWWFMTTLQERQAWHRFTCLNSRAPLDLCVIKDMKEKVGRMMDKKP